MKLLFKFDSIKSHELSDHDDTTNHLADIGLDGIALQTRTPEELNHLVPEIQESLGAVRLVMAETSVNSTGRQQDLSLALARRWYLTCDNLGIEALALPGPSLDKLGHINSILRDVASFWMDMLASHPPTPTGPKLLQHNTGHLSASTHCWTMLNQIEGQSPGLLWDVTAARAAGEEPSKSLPMLSRSISHVLAAIDSQAVEKLEQEKPDSAVPQSELLRLVRRLVGLGFKGSLTLDPKGSENVEQAITLTGRAAKAIKTALQEYEEATRDPEKYGKKKLAEAAKRAKELKAKQAAQEKAEAETKAE